MLELTVQLKFTTASLGNQKDPKTGRFCFQRSVSGRIMYLSTWHKSNMLFASQIAGKGQTASQEIMWDVEVDASLREDCLTRCYYKKKAGAKERWSTHESLMPGQMIGINCVLPEALTSDDFWELLKIAGQYKGLSPWQPGKWGNYLVDSITPRRQK